MSNERLLPESEGAFSSDLFEFEVTWLPTPNGEGATLPANPVSLPELEVESEAVNTYIGGLEFYGIQRSADQSCYPNTCNNRLVFNGRRVRLNVTGSANCGTVLA